MNYNSQINSCSGNSNTLWRPSKFFQTKILGSTCGGVSIFNKGTWMSNLYSGYEDLFNNSSKSALSSSNYTGGYLNNNNSNDYFYNKYNSSSENQQSEILALLKELVGSFFNKNQWNS